MKILERATTPYNEIDVCAMPDGSIDFDVVGATHATWHPQRLLTGHAWDAITAAILCHPAQPRTLLMLGLGGATVLRQVRQLLPDLEITAVEIDPVMRELARKYMELDSLRLNVVIGDAYAYLDQEHARFDVVVDDLYKSGLRDVERPVLFEKHRLARLADRTTEGGIVVANMVIGAGHRNQHSLARRVFCERFDQVRALRPPLSQNEVLCGGSRLRPSRKTRGLHRAFPLESDQKRWKELRTFPLR